MAGETRLHVWDRRGRKYGARLAHEGGGLLTIAIENSEQPRFALGEPMWWSSPGRPLQSERTGGTVASSYISAGVMHVIASPAASAMMPGKPETPAAQELCRV